MRNRFLTFICPSLVLALLSCLHQSQKQGAPQSNPVASDNARPKASPVVEQIPSPNPSVLPSPVMVEIEIKVPFKVLEATYFPDGILDQKTITLWSESDAKAISTKTYEGRRSEASEAHSFVYANGLLVRDESLNAEGRIKAKKTYKYDGDGRVIEEVSYDDKDKVLIRQSYLYDEKGRKRLWIVSDPNGMDLARTEYRYLPKGLGQIVLMDGKSVVESIVDITRDALGQEVSRTCNSADGNLEYRELKRYDGDRLISEERWSGSGRLVYAIDYQYADSDVVSKAVTKDGEGNILRYTEFEYQYRQTKVLRAKGETK